MEKKLSCITVSANYYETREAFMLEHLECMDCKVTVAKITPGEYYCPSCGDTASE